MKKGFKSIMLFAVAAMTFTACNKENDIQDVVKNGETTTIRFSAAVNDAETKATLTTEDENSFKAAWEESDKMEITVTSGSSAQLFPATWNGNFFEFGVPTDWAETVSTWKYEAYYPSKVIPFGSNRIQNGSQYASQYDAMQCEMATFENAKCGLDSEGGHIVLPMTRVSSILYFHLTSDFEETLASATLTVDEGTIAAETVAYDYEINALAAKEGTGSNTITLTFAEGTAPSAKDFCLWYNVIPGKTTGMTLTITTTSGKTATLSNPSGKTYLAGKLNKVVKNGLTWVNPQPAEKYYVKVTTLTQIVEDAQYVIGATYNSGDGNVFYAIPAKPTLSSGKISGEEVTVSANGVAESDAGGYVWTLSKSGDYYTLSDGSGYLYHSNGGNSGTNLGYGKEAKYLWAISEENSPFKFAGVNNQETKDRGLLYSTENEVFGGYSLSNFGNANYSGIELYVLQDDREALATPTNLQVNDMTLSWDAVDGAANYSVTIGEVNATVEGTSYTFEGEADYYNVSVVANPVDETTHKASAAATLSDAKFGTPTLSAPSLKRGEVNETSIEVLWTNDQRAFNYHAGLYSGNTLLEEKDGITTGSVKFSDLEQNTTYTIKVYANSTSGEKAYEASDEAIIEVTTDEVVTIAKILSEGNTDSITLPIATVMAKQGNYTVLSDGTGNILVFNPSGSHDIGDVVKVTGAITTYSNAYQFSSATITKISEGSTNYPSENLIDAEAPLVSYAQGEAGSARVIYATLRGKVESGKIVIGSKTITTYNSLTSLNNKDVEAKGYLTGWYNNNIYFVVVSAEEYIDPNAPTMVIDPESLALSWIATESGSEKAKTITVTLNEAATGYNVSYTDADNAWTVSDNESGIITVYPNEANSSTTADKNLILTISHNDDATLTKTFTLTQSKTSSGATFKDVITAANLTATSSTYSDFSGVSITSNAKYAGNSAKSSAGGIQLRSKNSNSGIVSTVSGGKVKTVKITVESGSNTIDVYGKNTAYTSAADLYNTDKGTKINSLSATGTITVEGDYNYIGIRSNSGAVYISSIEITWEN